MTARCIENDGKCPHPAQCPLYCQQVDDQVREARIFEAPLQAAPEDGLPTGNLEPLNIPPDPEGMNNDRAMRAHQAILAFETAAGADREDALRDLLCNLMHWCDREGREFAWELDRARVCYGAETRDAG